MVLSKNAEANIRFISDCLEEADIGTDSSLYILRGLILILLILLLIMRSVCSSARIKKLQQNSKTNFAGIDGGK